MDSPVSPTVILVEDDAAFARELTEFLEAHGLRVEWLSMLEALVSRLRDVRPDLLILDQFVSGRDSLPLIAELRTAYTGGVVVLTGNEDPTDRIVALESGADDFVAKALGPRELLARLRSVLRRSAAPPAPVTTQPHDPPSGSWQINTRRVELRAPDGSVLPLTRTEFQALLVLTRKAGDLTTRDHLSLVVLGRPFSPLDRSVDNMVSRIRKVLEPHMHGLSAISSVRGKGYVFDAFNLSETIITDPAGVLSDA